MSRLFVVFAALISLTAAVVHAADAAPRPPASLPDEIADWRASVLETLDTKVTLDLIDTPLSELVAVLRDQTGVNVRLDERALEDVGIGSDHPVSRRLKDWAVRDALTVILREPDLTWVVRDGAVVITTPEEADTELITRAFLVLDLIRPQAQAGLDEYDDDALVGLIRRTVEPETWWENGGAGEINAYGGTLVVSQTRRPLERVAQLLAALRAIGKQQPGDSERVPLRMSLPVDPRQGKVFETALEEKTTLEFIETPLTDVAAYLQDLHGIKIDIHERALDDVGIGNDTPITLNLKGISLCHGLRHMLRPLDLMSIPEENWLLITTPEDAESRLNTRLYPVADLVVAAPLQPAAVGSLPGSGDLDSIMDLIQWQVAPTTWFDAGGTGGIEAFDRADVLVISQTAEVHREIEQFLSELRSKIPATQVAPAADAERRKSMRLIVYKMLPDEAADEEEADKSEETRHQSRDPDVDASQLLKVVQDLVEPESWKREGVYAQALPQRLVVRQTRDVHRKIRHMLYRLGVEYRELSDRPSGPFGGAHSHEPMGSFGGGLFNGTGLEPEESPGLDLLAPPPGEDNPFRSRSAPPGLEGDPFEGDDGPFDDKDDDPFGDTENPF